MWLAAGVLSLLAGFALGLLGGGGSILTVPILVYVLGLEPRSAIGTSLVVVAATSLSAGLVHARAGAVRWRSGLLFGGAGVVGASLGGLASGAIPPAILFGAFGMMVVTTALMMIRPAKTPARTSDGARLVPMLVAGVGVGFLTGLVGAGGGFLIVPALVFFGGFSMPAATATSLLVITLNSLTGFVSVTISGAEVKLGLAALMSILSVAGSFAGARLGRRLHPDRLRQFFGLFVLGLGGFIVTHEGASWIQVSGSNAAALGIVVGMVLAGGGHLIWSRRETKPSAGLGAQ